ncbi:aspartate aminotransferase family protein [Parasulfitobacter algicola]|uniref:Aspartate aminotransferase family protein n=1 Tax=Parasulfitobacter algicola TaxID=2614809 RepID=A0ABX2IVP9_9RHOB|nr:aspartate aminotransferase family protein [Sulfitobacter algicola]NSX54351.1 aspartate aminotransferase family protein [Sulfitobacter algicola]
MSHVFPRHTKSDLPFAVKGQGAYLYDHKGKQYLDASGGAAVSCLGHGDADVIAAIKAQADALAYAHTSFFTSHPAEELADKLVAAAPGDLDRVYLVSGGSEAVEAALKLARQYFIEIDQPERHRFVARRQSYHGNTLGALATGGNAWRREPFAPLMVQTSHIAPCYEYRGLVSGETQYDYGQRVANELEEELLRLGPETVIGFVVEPVVGATLGAVPAVNGYFKRIREICDRYGVLLILDEVMCGMGRTGTLFAHAFDGITADIVTIAKGLGAGYQPIGAMMCTSRIYDAIADGSGFFQHGHTYVGHPMACAAANVVMDKLIKCDLVQRCSTMGTSLQDALVQTFGQHSNIGDIRGRGLFIGLELVADRETKQPFAPDLAIHKLIKRQAFENGLACYPMGGTLDGKIGDHILLAPPFILEPEHIDEIVEKLSQTLKQVLGK